MNDQKPQTPATPDGAASELTEGLERMFMVTEFNHPEHATYKWTKLECEWINDRIRTAMAAEREACAIACEETGEQPSSLWEEPGCWTQAAETCAFVIRMRSNAEVTGAPPHGAKQEK